MDFKRLQIKAKQLIEKRGGTGSAKADAEALTDIAKGPGSVADKAKRAADVLADPGAKRPDPSSAPPSAATAQWVAGTGRRRPRQLTDEIARSPKRAPSSRGTPG